LLALTRNDTTEYFPDSDQERVMKLYWKARQEGDGTAALKKVPDPPPDDEPPPPGVGMALAAPDDRPRAAALPSAPAPSTQPGQISEVAQERIALQEEWLGKAGFSLAPPLYAPGTRVIALGDNNFRTERTRVERLPLFQTAADSTVQTIAREDRADLALRLGEVEMDDSGRLRVGDESFGLTLPAFRQFATLAGFGAGVRYLSELCDAQLRGDNVSWQLRNRSKRDKEVVLRTRVTEGRHRQVFATVTPSYAAVDSDEVLRAAGADLTDARTELVYDGTGVRATAIFMPDQVIDLAVGDVFKAGVRIETDDTGRGRIRVMAVVWRNRCLNLLIVGEGTVETMSQVHRGDPGRILSAVHDGVTLAREKVGEFLEAWGHARQVHLPEPKEELASWVDKGRIELPLREDPKRIVDALFAAYDEEPGETVADLVNAVSRAAHQTPRWGMDVRESLERQAAELVYAYA